jgi:lysophospholipase L1-like esterase
VLPTSVPHLSTRRQILRAGFTAAVGSWAALELLGSGRADASGTPPTSLARISMVGDSLTCGSLPYQADAFAATGWSRSTIDAYVSRGVRTKVKADHHTGLTAVDAMRAKFGDTKSWVVALGTNDAVIYKQSRQVEVIRQMMDLIGPGHSVLWVNVYLPEAQPLQLAWNTALETVANAGTSEMYVYDWASFAAENQRWLAHDRLHYSADGYRYRSTAIGLASRELLPSNSESTPPDRWRLSRAKILNE